MAHKITKRIVGLLVAVVMVLGTVLGMSGTEVYAEGNEINGHQYLTSNSRYALYVNEEDLSVVVEDKVTGAYMESSISYDDGKNNASWLGAMKSAIVMTLINGNNDTLQADIVNDDVTKKVSYTPNGFSAQLFWNKYKLGMTLEVELTEDGLVARIPEESIIEQDEKYYIGTIAIYPYMGTSYIDDKEGYMLLPDGNGALIYLNDKEGRYKNGYSSMIYGSDAGFDELTVSTLLWDRYDTINDSEKIIAPVFGIAHTDDQMAFLGIVEEGEARATIEAIPNGVSVDYNRAYAKFILRKTYTQPTSNNSTAGSLHTSEADRSHSNLGVRFVFLSDDKANYAGMANAYRDYLFSRNQLSQHEDSYKTRIDFLGTERKAWVIGTSAVPMTTVEDIEYIYKDLKEASVDKLMSVYKGWQKGGLYDIPITTYKADSKIGGTNELTKLIKDASSQGISLYLYNDGLRINPDENNATFNIIKKINKRRYEEKTYKDVYENMLYLTPTRSATLLSKFVTSYTKKGVSNLCMAGMTNTLFSYNYSGTNYTRYDTQASYLKTMADIDEKANVIMEQPFEYMWAYTDSFLDMPMYVSSYIYEDESVPFLSIVLKGIMPVYSEYVNFEANKQEFFLKMIETGTYPSFYITMEDSSELIYTNSSDIYSSQYSVYKDTIVQYSKELGEFNQKVAGATITGHDILDNQVRVVTYSNGVKVYVNYSSSSQTVDGVSIPSMSYSVEVGK